MKALARIEFLYWAERRQRTCSVMHWLNGIDCALSDAGYCLDRPENTITLSDVID